MSFDDLKALADAVLLEGYLLYPYRASALKNRYRWTFGVLAPRSWSEAGGCEPWRMEAQCLISGDGGRELEGKLRFLQVESRALDLPDRSEAMPWEEGVPREVDLWDILSLRSGRAPLEVPFETAGGPRGVVRISAAEVPAETPLLRLSVSVENLTPCEALGAQRQDILRESLVAAHLMLRVSGGDFVSLLDPPPWARDAAAATRSTGTYPVLAGPRGRRDRVLSAPIVLYDHPALAPESPGDFFDATEIDELLTLRTATLTPAEKREVRATDPRGAALLDRVEQMPQEEMERLHGAVRSFVPAIPPGTRVRLRRATRRADAQDLLFEGRTATIREVLHDVDGRVYFAVSIDGDPMAEIGAGYPRWRHYGDDEVDLL